LKKYSKGMLRMSQQDGIEVSGEFSPFIRACIGIAIVLFAGGVFLLFAAPFLRALRWW